MMIFAWSMLCLFTSTYTFCHIGENSRIYKMWIFIAYILHVFNKIKYVQRNGLLIVILSYDSCQIVVWDFLVIISKIFKISDNCLYLNQNSQTSNKKYVACVEFAIPASFVMSITYKLNCLMYYYFDIFQLMLNRSLIAFN